MPIDIIACGCGGGGDADGDDLNHISLLSVPSAGRRSEFNEKQIDEFEHNT